MEKNNRSGVTFVSTLGLLRKSADFPVAKAAKVPPPPSVFRSNFPDALSRFLFSPPPPEKRGRKRVVSVHAKLPFAFFLRKVAGVEKGCLLYTLHLGVGRPRIRYGSIFLFICGIVRLLTRKQWRTISLCMPNGGIHTFCMVSGSPGGGGKRGKAKWGGGGKALFGWCIKMGQVGMG